MKTRHENCTQDSTQAVPNILWKPFLRIYFSFPVIWIWNVRKKIIRRRKKRRITRTTSYKEVVNYINCFTNAMQRKQSLSEPNLYCIRDNLSKPMESQHPMAGFHIYFPNNEYNRQSLKCIGVIVIMDWQHIQVFHKIFALFYFPHQAGHIKIQSLFDT